MPILTALLLLLISSTVFSDASGPEGEQIVIQHKSGVYVTKQELMDEVKYIAKAKKIENQPDRATLEGLSLQMLITKMLSKEAEARALDQDPEVAYEIKRSRDIALSNARVREIENVEIDESVQKQLGKEYYLAKREEFTDPEQRDLSHILIKSTDDEGLKKAQGLLKQIEDDPEKFTELAKQHSEDERTAVKGGLLGWGGKDRFIKPFAEAAYEIASVGQVVGPVKSPFGYHIIRLNDLKAAQPHTYEEVETQAIEKAVEAFRAERKAQFINNLSASGDRTLDEAVIGGYVKELQALDEE
jgi:parvulin-like peptidyl-prolyl isomerase